MTIEEKALKTWGETEHPKTGIWILKNGIMINGCMSGYLNDVDHAEIGQFFKTSKFHEPGSNWLYIKKFINRGNIRMRITDIEAYFELSRIPTPAQWRAMGKCFAFARRFDIPVRIERMGLIPGTGKSYTRLEYVAHLERYAPTLVA